MLTDTVGQGFGQGIVNNLSLLDDVWSLIWGDLHSLGLE